jgi:hypothetical protein
MGGNALLRRSGALNSCLRKYDNRRPSGANFDTQLFRNKAFTELNRVSELIILIL